ncbi:hypothetical protein IFM89_008836 [Coptis chinensis]|uniref:Uncharacterized protein n=1 Tax=Coptis chinensis TaxID=261450 RepID=A0A835HC25_9MAGN|nr:hypothetical protein IFM89_008836 [Coptis chinensis]
MVIVDTSNEIGGDGDIPHEAIGGAWRMQVPEPSMQHKVMIEAVENHMPEVIIVDEIGTEAEALACCSIAERGSDADWHCPWRAAREHNKESYTR